MHPQRHPREAFGNAKLAENLEKLNNLIHLASVDSQDSRRQLLREITDFFLDDSDAYSDQQNWYFGDIMGQLAYDLEKQVRAELANRLSANGNAPKELIWRLANDEIAIASPVLQKSPVLSQSDLIEITRHQSQEHLTAITARPDISADLSKELVSHGDDNVVVNLLRNDSADIQVETMQQIADRSAESENMQTAIVDRDNVPKEILKDLMNQVSNTLRKQILDKYADVGTEQLDAVVSSMKGSLDDSASKAEKYIDDFINRGALTESLLLRFVADERPMEFLVGFARLTEIDSATAKRVLADKTGTALSVVCRANAITPDTFKEIAMSPMCGIPSDHDRVLPLVRLYLRLKAENAQRAMRFWRTKKGALDTIAEPVKNSA
jgi:uncharacterized protein (DUF2336 family)